MKLEKKDVLDFNIIIPARKGSKGWPLKNRTLMKYTFDLVDNCNVIVTSDDSVILDEAIKRKFKTLIRDKKLAQDETSTKDVLLDVVERFKLQKNDNIMMLYLTYPYRTTEDIKRAIIEFKKNNASSLLCMEPVLTHPYLTIIKKNDRWQQTIKHNLYRRQDYPIAMQICHYISIMKIKELKKLNKNLYNKNTYFMKIERVKDVDYKEDL